MAANPYDQYLDESDRSTAANVPAPELSIVPTNEGINPYSQYLESAERRTSLSDALAKRYATMKDVWEKPGIEAGGALGPFNVPYKAFNIAGQGAGMAADVLGAGLTEGLEYIVPDPSARAEMGGFLGNLPGVQGAKELWGQTKEMFPRAALTAESAANLAAVAPASVLASRAVMGISKGAVGLAKDAKMAVASRSLNATDSAITKAIHTGFRKYIRPSYRGKSDASLSAKFYDNADMAVRDIVERYPGTPLSKADDIVQEFSNRVYTTKKAIWGEAAALRDRAKEAGILVDTDPIVADLIALGNDPALRRANIDLAKAYLKEAETISSGSRYIPPQVAEDMITQFNARSQPFWNDPKMSMQAVVPARAGDILRKQLFDAMESLGPQYANLRKRYGAQVAIEREVQNRATQFGRKAEYGLFDISNIAIAADFVKSLVRATKGDFTALLGAPVAYTVKHRMTQINSVSYGIRKMFEDVELLSAVKKKYASADMKGVSPPRIGPFVKSSEIDRMISAHPPAIPLRPEDVYMGTILPSADVLSGVAIGRPYMPNNLPAISPKASPGILVNAPDDIFRQRLPSTDVKSGIAQGLEKYIPNLQHPVPLNSLKNMTMEELKQYLLRNRNIKGMMSE